MSILVDVNTVLGLCYSSAWLTGAACLFHLTYKFVRNHTYVKVNCWFCNLNSKVLYADRKEWYCSYCQQFNGFKKDGDYSRVIPQQYNESLNTKFVSRSSSKAVGPSNGLCRICNANQELKVRQLALYEPFKEENYDSEIEIFRQRLEKSYKLCSICERTVESTLRLKSAFLPKTPARTCKQIKVKESTQSMNSSTRTYIVLISASAIALFFVWRSDLRNIRISGRKPSDFLNDIVNKVDQIDVPYGDKRVINALLLLTATFFARSWTEKGRIFVPVLFGIVTALVGCNFAQAVKVTFIILFTSFYGFKYWQNRKKSWAKYRAANDLTRLIADDGHETGPEENLFASNATNNPLCGQFSDLNLGHSTRAASDARKISYLFKPTKPLIQPSRLKLDDSDTSETARTSPTISSGYESVSSYFKKSPDSVSEFDSISQVGRYCDVQSEMKRRGTRKGNDFAAPVGSRWAEFGQSSNAVTPYSFRKRYSSHSPEPYYEVSPTLSSHHSSASHLSQFQTNSCFSTVQVVLCSLAFFVLGFSLQLLIKKYVF